MNSAASAGSFTERRRSLNWARISRRASEARIFMCDASPPSGAAIRKMMSAGPSGAPKSTPWLARPNARLGSLTWADRQCGMPIPPSRPVGICDSRLAMSARNPSMSVTRPALTRRSASWRDADCRSGADRSRSTRSAVMTSLILEVPLHFGVEQGGRSRQGSVEIRVVGDHDRVRMQIRGSGHDAAGQLDGGGPVRDGGHQRRAATAAACEVARQCRVARSHGAPYPYRRSPPVKYLVRGGEEGTV